MNAKQKFMVIAGAGVAIGIAEALLYYNLGKNEQSEEFQFGVPKGKELVKSLGIVLVTSTLTALLSNQIEKALEGDLKVSSLEIA